MAKLDAERGDASAAIFHDDIQLYEQFSQVVLAEINPDTLGVMDRSLLIRFLNLARFNSKTTAAYLYINNGSTCSPRTFNLRLALEKEEKRRAKKEMNLI